ncbi:hypothetical protein FRC18_010563 [Serendipita sp. 400]|nr:hypothetical protein FRC18_010563 [Serendipita sp. 400]
MADLFYQLYFQKGSGPRVYTGTNVTPINVVHSPLKSMILTGFGQFYRVTRVDMLPELYWGDDPDDAMDVINA